MLKSYDQVMINKLLCSKTTQYYKVKITSKKYILHKSKSKILIKVYTTNYTVIFNQKCSLLITFTCV